MNTKTDLKLTPVVAPLLSATDFGANVRKLFENINRNFEILANKDFVKGEQGESVRIELISLGKTYHDVQLEKLRLLLLNRIEFAIKGSHDDLELEPIYYINSLDDQKASVLNWYDNLRSENAILYLIYKNDVIISSLAFISLDSRFNSGFGKQYVKSQFYDQYNNRVLIDESEAYENKTDVSCSIYLRLKPDESDWEVALINNCPTLYYDIDIADFCWHYQGVDTKIPARGPQGNDANVVQNMFLVQIDGQPSTPKSNICNILNVMTPQGDWLEINKYVNQYKTNGWPEINKGSVAIVFENNASGENNKYWISVIAIETDKYKVTCSPETNINGLFNENSFVEIMKRINPLKTVKGFFIPFKPIEQTSIPDGQDINTNAHCIFSSKSNEGSPDFRDLNIASLKNYNGIGSAKIEDLLAQDSSNYIWNKTVFKSNVKIAGEFSALNNSFIVTTVKKNENDNINTVGNINLNRITKIYGINNYAGLDNPVGFDSYSISWPKDSLQNYLLYGGSAVGKIYTENGKISKVGAAAEIFNDYKNNKALANYSHAEGSQSTASGDCSHAEGQDNKALANYSHAEGLNNVAKGTASHAEGMNNKASGISSHIEGTSTNKCEFDKETSLDNIITKWNTNKFSFAQKDNSHVEGQDNLALARNSHVEGVNNIALGISSHAEGMNNKTDKDIEGSHAEGKYNYSNGFISTIGVGIDDSNRSNALAVTPEGKIYINGVGEYKGTTTGNTLSLADSIVGKKDITSGINPGEIFNDYANNEAGGNYSHAEGMNNKTDKDIEGSHAEGKYNYSNGFISTIGVGIDDSNRSNALAVTPEGKIYINGVGRYNGTADALSISLLEVIENLSTDKKVIISKLVNNVKSTSEVLKYDADAEYVLNETDAGTSLILAEVKLTPPELGYKYYSHQDGVDFLGKILNGRLYIYKDTVYIGTGGKLKNISNAVIATDKTIGGIKIGYKDDDINYGVQLDDESRAYVKVPSVIKTGYNNNQPNADTIGRNYKYPLSLEESTNKAYTLIPIASSDTKTAGVIELGYNDGVNSKINAAGTGYNFPVSTREKKSVSGDYENVPAHVEIPLASDALESKAGLIKLGYLGGALNGTLFAAVKASATVGAHVEIARAQNEDKKNHGYVTLSTNNVSSSEGLSDVTFFLLAPKELGYTAQVHVPMADIQTGNYGLVKLGYTTDGNKIAVSSSDGKLFVEIPSAGGDKGAAGLVKLGFESEPGSGNLAVKAGEKTGALYVNVPIASGKEDTPGLVKLGYTKLGNNIPVESINGSALCVQLPSATKTDAGIIKLGYATKDNNIAVETDANGAYVTIPKIPVTTSTTAGLIQVSEKTGTDGDVFLLYATDTGVGYVLIDEVPKAKSLANNSDIGSSEIPVYFNAAGVPTACSGTVNKSKSADYAEMFEWNDGNPNQEDRVGYMVSVNNGNIEKANGCDILGVISASPMTLGNNPFEWPHKYITDEWGRETKELNPDYDESKKYIRRSARSEWSPVGLLGQLRVRLDGSLKVNEYCSAKDGVATYDKNGKVKVLKIFSDKIALVLIK